MSLLVDRVLRGLSGRTRLATFSLALIVSCFLSYSARAQQPSQSPAQSPSAKQIGSIKTIVGSHVVLSTDSGADYDVSVQDNSKILRIEPGAKDLKNAAPMQLSDLQAGDRILVMGKSSDGHSISAGSIIVMKKADVISKQENERKDWQARGVGGLVSAVDPGAQTITISTQSLSESKNIVIDISKSTVLRRYAPDSVKFDDAKPGAIEEIKPGDQLRARGTHNPDGTTWAAEEVVTGAFRNIAGTISSVDAASNTLNLMDLSTKKPVSVKVTPDSQLRKLSPQVAQFMATRLKQAASASVSAGSNAVPPNGANGTTGAGTQSAAGSQRSADSSSGTGGRQGRAGGDFQQMLSRIPPATLADLQKGDAVMIVSTQGGASGSVTAITLLAGVEPILEASPGGGAQSMILPPWSLDSGAAADAAQ